MICDLDPGPLFVWILTRFRPSERAGWGKSRNSIDLDLREIVISKDNRHISLARIESEGGCLDGDPRLIQ
jgi:hypothetical protein